MTEQEQIEQAIAVLDAQRSLIGKTVADIAIAVLNDRLAVLRQPLIATPSHTTPQRKQITTLFAGIAGLAGHVDTGRDPDLWGDLRILWRRLDEAITEQGGVIDKHFGDGVMGLFGVPVAREDDPERAVRAALAMRDALDNLAAEGDPQFRRAKEATRENAAEESGRPDGKLQLRVGINTGPALHGKVGTGDEFSAIGASVNVASRLEQAAPLGGILISHATYNLVRDRFVVEPLGHIAIRGKSEPIAAYQVIGMKPVMPQAASPGVDGLNVEMVGRRDELNLLQEAWDMVLRQGVGQLIAITGDAGVGKTRLSHEFLQNIHASAGDFVVFKGRGDQHLQHLPYSLIRNLFATYFGIQDTDLAVEVEEKLTRGLAQHMGQGSIDVSNRVHAIGQLIGLSVAGRSDAFVMATETPQVRERVLNYVMDFFEAAARTLPAILIILEDIHWADEKSLALIHQFERLCSRFPVLILQLGRPQPTLLQRPGKRADVGAGDALASPLERNMHLSPLSRQESRQLVESMLHTVAPLPDDLADLIVERAEGNPYYIEELVKVLIEDGVITASQEQMQVQHGRLRNIRLPLTLSGVLQARLDRLSPPELAALQGAAVVGRVFWDAAIIRIGEATDEPQAESETRLALELLEQRELIFRQPTSSFTGTVEYAFKNAIMRDFAYESVLLRNRAAYHRVAADWLAERSGERIAEYSALIAEHYERAREKALAAELFELAARRAQEMYDPELAIRHLVSALSLLATEQQHSGWQLRIQERLGRLLQMQARFVDAAQNYLAMRFVADEDGDLLSQARALNGLAAVYREQADYKRMLSGAGDAEQVAWLIGDDEELTIALRHKAEALYRLGDTEAAQVAADRALSRSRRLDTPQLQISTLSLLCTMGMESGRASVANDHLHTLERLVREVESQGDVRQVLAFARASVGRILNKLGWHEPAAYRLFAALDVYRELDRQLEMARTLNTLGETIRSRGDHQAAVSLYQEALSIADAIGDRYGKLFFRTNLGAALIGLGEYKAAIQELEWAIQLGEDVAQVVHWRGLPKAGTALAQAYLALGEVAAAREAAQKAHAWAEKSGKPRWLGTSWRLLGMVAAVLPVDQLPLIVSGRAYDAAECFNESLGALRPPAGDNPATYRDQMETLAEWSRHALELGNDRQADELNAELEQLRQRSMFAFHGRVVEAG